MINISNVYILSSLHHLRFVFLFSSVRSFYKWEISPSFMSISCLRSCWPCYLIIDTLYSTAVKYITRRKEELSEQKLVVSFITYYFHQTIHTKNICNDSIDAAYIHCRFNIFLSSKINSIVFLYINIVLIYKLLLFFLILFVIKNILIFCCCRRALVLRLKMATLLTYMLPISY